MANTATTKIFFDKYHPKADGSCAVSIRVTFNRVKRYYGTKHTLTPEKYQAIFSVDAKSKDREILHDLVNEEERAKDIISDLKNKFNFTLFERRFNIKGTSNNVFELFKRRAAELRSENRIGTAVTYECAMNSLETFHVKTSLSFDEIDIVFLNKYKFWMQKKDNSNATIGIYLRNLRALFNEAISDGVISDEIYPFGKGRKKFKIPTGKNTKKALTFPEIATIYRYVPDTESKAKGRDFWLLSYLSNGANVKDLLMLKIGDIGKEFITFQRQKTKRENEDKPVIIEIPLSPDIWKIIKRWGVESVNPKDFVFPVLDSNQTADEQYKLIQLFTRFINENMKKVVKELHITAKTTTYYARHSFSTILRNSGESVEFISESLGHKSIRTTQNYLAGFDSSRKKKASAVLTDFSKLSVVA